MVVTVDSLSYLWPNKITRRRYNLNLESFATDRFYGRQPDGVAINKALQIAVLECKRSTDGDEDFVEL